MKKWWKIFLAFLSFLLVLYLSLDIRRLEDSNQGRLSGAFDAKSYVADFWENKLPLCIDNATDISLLAEQLRSNPDAAFNSHGHSLGISSTYYFFVKGSGVIDTITSENVVISTGSGTHARLATLYVFGNAVRDGSGMVDINGFLNMMDFNQVSVEINKRVKQEIIAKKVPQLRPGQTIRFKGAAELHRKKFNPDFIPLIPVQIITDDGPNP